VQGAVINHYAEVIQPGAVHKFFSRKNNGDNVKDDKLYTHLKWVQHIERAIMGNRVL